MSVPISTIVNVQISRETQAVTQAGFGVPLILGDNSSGWGSERVRTYLNMEEVATDFTSSHEEYLAAQAIFSQSPRVERIKIAREASRVAQQRTLTFSANLVTGNSIAGTVDGVALSATPFNTSNAQTLTDLATALQATAGIATAVSNGTNQITITAANAGIPVLLSGFVVTGGASQPTITIATTVASHGIAEDLAEIQEEDDDWYGLIWIERTQGYVEQAAAAIEARRKIFITCTDAAGVLVAATTTDLGSVLSAANYARTAVIWNDEPNDFADAAWMGKLFPYDPGSETWNFKTLNSITADGLTSTQRAGAQGKDVNIYVTVGGVDITEEGVMASGEFIDVIRGVDWLQARMEETIFARLARVPKIPYTDAGVQNIVNLMRGVLNNAIAVGLLSGDALDPDNDIQTPYTVSYPRVVDVPENDRAERFLPDLRFTARLAGAIHRVTIQGVVTV